MSLDIAKAYARFFTSTTARTVPTSLRGTTFEEIYDISMNQAVPDAARVPGGGHSLLCSLGDLMLPTEENVRWLSSSLSCDLRGLFSQSGIAVPPPIEFSVGSGGEIQIKGDRADKERILRLVGSNEPIATQIRTVSAISSHVVGMTESLKFQREYFSSSDPEGVVNKYAQLFSSLQRSHSISLSFDGNGVKVMADGTQWFT